MSLPGHATDGARATRPTCFIAMPMTTTAEQADTYGDPQHWSNVLERFFVPAIEAAGLEPVRPSAEGTLVVHERIVDELCSAALVLADLSGANANVHLELGIRIALDLPIALVHDHVTAPVFDTRIVSAHRYTTTPKLWHARDEVAGLTQHLLTSLNTRHNAFWQLFGRQRGVGSDVANHLAAYQRTLDELFPRQDDDLLLATSMSNEQDLRDHAAENPVVRKAWALRLLRNGDLHALARLADGGDDFAAQLLDTYHGLHRRDERRAGGAWRQPRGSYASDVGVLDAIHQLDALHRFDEDLPGRPERRTAGRHA